MRYLIISFYFISLILILGFSKNDFNTTKKVGDTIIDFKLQNIDKSFVSLNGFKNAKGFMVVFTCNHCPFAKLYTKRLNDLNNKYKPMGVPLLAINSMDTMLYKDEVFSNMQQRAKTERYNFYYLQDAQQVVAKDFGAKHTPQAYVIWKENGAWVIKYTGSIDDDGEHPLLAKPYLSIAVDELLAGKKLSISETESFGCRIFYRK